LPAIEIISTRKVGKRVSPSRVFTEYIGNENETGNGFAGQNGAGNGFTGSIGLVCEWEWEWLTALRVVMASHMGTASHMGITS
jgi:hypothetical protein